MSQQIVGKVRLLGLIHAQFLNYHNSRAMGTGPAGNSPGIGCSPGIDGKDFHVCAATWRRSRCGCTSPSSTTSLYQQHFCAGQMPLRPPAVARPSSRVCNSDLVTFHCLIRNSISLGWHLRCRCQNAFLSWCFMNMLRPSRPLHWCSLTPFHVWWNKVQVAQLKASDPVFGSNKLLGTRKAKPGPLALKSWMAVLFRFSSKAHYSCSVQHAWFSRSHERNNAYAIAE